MHRWSSNIFSSIAKPYKTRIVHVFVQMDMIRGQEYNLDFSIYSHGNLPTALMSTGSQMGFVDSWGVYPCLLPSLLDSNGRQGKKKSDTWRTHRNG